MIKAVIFDNDGVLFDSEPMHFMSIKELSKEYGVNMTKKWFFANAAGENSAQIFGEIFKDKKRKEIQKMVDENSRLFLRKYLPRVKTIPGIKKFISLLKRTDTRMIVVSNGHKGNVKGLLSHNNINLDFITLGDFKRPKPDPEGYVLALKKLRVKKGEAIIFEDSIMGIESAVRADIRVVGVRTKNTVKSLKEAGAFETIRDFNDPKLGSIIKI